MNEMEDKTEEKKVISIEDRIPKLKEERKKKANRRLIFYLTIFFILIAFVVYLQSPYSNVKEITVIGNDVVPIEEIKELSGIDDETNIWMLQKRKAKKDIEGHPLIETMTIKRSLPQTVKITVTEFNIIGYTEEKGKYYPVLVDGSVLKDYPMSYRGDRPFILNFDEQAYMEMIATQLNELPKHVLRLISEVSWEPTKNNKNKILLYMNDGFIVDATLRDFSDKMKNYPSIIAQLDPKEKGIVHMGVGIYFEKIKKK